MSEAINESIMPATSEFLARNIRIIIGKNIRGHWVVVDRLGQYGGLFHSQKDAIRFGLDAANRIQSAPAILAGILEFNFAGAQETAAPQTNSRRAA
jgi:hypothetical protein